MFQIVVLYGLCCTKDIAVKKLIVCFDNSVCVSSFLTAHQRSI